MIPEQNIAQFLENYNRNDKVHQRTYKMFCEVQRDSRVLRDLVALLVDSGVNVENLTQLLEEAKQEEEAEKPVTTAVFDANGSYDFTNGTRMTPRAEETDLDEKPAAKRQKISESNWDEVETPPIPGIIPDPTGEYKSAERDYRTAERSVEYRTADYRTADRSIDHRTTDYRTADHRPTDTRPTDHKPARYEETVRPPLVDQTNKRDLSDTVFYENILSEAKPKSGAPRGDPYYLFPILQCKLCGLRFPKEHSDSFGQHIEDHRRFTHALGEKTMLRREFFSTKNQCRIEKLDLVLEGGPEEIVWEGESPNCAVCGGVIKKRWNDDLENWVLDDGTKISELEAAHRRCLY